MVPNLKEIISSKLNEKYFNKEINGTMIKNIKINDFNNIPLSRTTTNNIEISKPVKIIYKLYKPGDTIREHFFLKMI